MQSLELHQAGAGDPEVDIVNSLALEAASRLALAKNHLLEEWTFAPGLVFAALFICLVDFVMSAAKAGQAFEAHLAVASGKMLTRNSVVASLGRCAWCKSVGRASIEVTGSLPRIKIFRSFV